MFSAALASAAFAASEPCNLVWLITARDQAGSNRTERYCLPLASSISSIPSMSMFRAALNAPHAAPTAAMCVFAVWCRCLRLAAAPPIPMNVDCDPRNACVCRLQYNCSHTATGITSSARVLRTYLSPKRVDHTDVVQQCCPKRLGSQLLRLFVLLHEEIVHRQRATVLIQT